MDLEKNAHPQRTWWLVPLAAVAMVATLPGRSVGLGLITDPLIAELGIERTHYNLLNFWATLIGAAAALGCGALIDRFGVRGAIAGTALLLGCSVLGMATAVTASTLLLFLILVRGLGQSALSAASITLLGKSFRKKLPLAMGAFGALVSIGFAAAFVSTKSGITQQGWRPIWLIIGVAILAVGVLLFLIVRNPPTTSVEIDAIAKPDDAPFVHFRNALTTLTFWVVALGNALYYLFFAGASLNAEDIFRELGFDPGTYPKAMGALMICGIVGNFLASWALPRIGLGRLLSVTLFLLAVVLVSYGSLATETHAIAHGALNGFCGGVFVVIFFSGFASVFGRRDLGKIQGAAQVLGVLASACGGVLLAEVKESTGSYFPVFQWLAPLFAILGTIAWFTRARGVRGVRE